MGVYGLALRGAQYAEAFLTNQQIYPSHGNMTPSKQSVDGAGSSIFQTSENRLFLWRLNMYEIFDAFLCPRIIVYLHVVCIALSVRLHGILRERKGRPR